MTKPTKVAARVASVGVAGVEFNVLQKSRVGQRNVQSALVHKRMREELGRSNESWGVLAASWGVL